MYVILCYDARKERDARLRKICRKYLYTTQKSVFEGNITESGLNRLKREIAEHINPEMDAVMIYQFPSAAMVVRAQIGVNRNSTDMIF